MNNPFNWVGEKFDDAGDWIKKNPMAAIAPLTLGTSLLIDDTAGTDVVTSHVDEVTGKKAQKDIKDAADKKLAYQQQALDKSLALQKEALDFNKARYDEYMGMIRPYQQMGENFLGKYQSFLDPETQAKFGAQALQSDEFQGIKKNVSDSLLSSSAAFGGLRSSGVQDRMTRNLSQLASNYANNKIRQRLGDLQNATFTGLRGVTGQMGNVNNAASGISSGVNGMAGTQFNGLNGMGQLQMDSAMAQAQHGLVPSLVNTAGGVANIYKSLNAPV